tara:strand:- start:310 stop:498 length:189 start_codon:yes stop_codon:yes gene_type:complete
MTILERLQRIVRDLDTRKLDARKFDEGNAAAGIRVRVSAMEAIKALRECRKEIQEIKVSRKN